MIGVFVSVANIRECNRVPINTSNDSVNCKIRCGGQFSSSIFVFSPCCINCLISFVTSASCGNFVAKNNISVLYSSISLSKFFAIPVI